MATKVVTYVGRTTDFKGKTLWEIVGSLKNFGVGRFVYRSVFQRYPEPSFMKIVKVETCPDEERRRVRVWVEKTFRGRKLPYLNVIYRTSYKPDYRLVPRNEEAKLLASVQNEPDVILPRTIEMPPLMKKFIVNDHERKGLEDKRDEIAAAGERVIIALYGGNPNTQNLDEMRYQLFTRAATKTSFNLARLPPTRDSALFHSLQTYHQIMEDLVLPISYNRSPNRVTRIAKPDEKPTIEFTMKLGKPASPSLYEGVPLN